MKDIEESQKLQSIKDTNDETKINGIANDLVPKNSGDRLEKEEEDVDEVDSHVNKSSSKELLDPKTV